MGVLNHAGGAGSAWGRAAWARRGHGASAMATVEERGKEEIAKNPWPFLNKLQEGPEALFRDLNEIGRASCRERVYVLV